MTDIAEDRLAEGKLDLVPMIDCIMLLLLFFILTTRFSSDEKRLDCLLPTTKGALLTAALPPVQPPERVNICIYPAGLDRGLQPSEYAQKVRALAGTSGSLPRAWLRIGRAEPMPIIGVELDPRSDAALASAAVNRIHRYIGDALAKAETGNIADREHQDPVVINCFSGMSWKFGLIAYDGVHAYESARRGRAFGDDRDTNSERAREVEFAPSRIRDYDPDEVGQELNEIFNMR